MGIPVEVEAIWGEPLRRAKAAGASTPKLEELDARIRADAGASLGEIEYLLKVFDETS